LAAARRLVPKVGGNPTPALYPHGGDPMFRYTKMIMARLTLGSERRLLSLYVHDYFE
jgi:hypothetical protein